MAQITWRNVNSDMTAYQGRALEGASRSFDSMFDKLAGAVNRTQAIDDKNYETGKVNRTNDALNQVMGYQNPEEFAAAQKAGAMQALLGSGAMIDQQAVRSAIDSRLPILQQREVQGINHKNTLLDERTNGLLEGARMASINGDDIGYTSNMQAYMAEGGRKPSTIAEFADGRKQLGVTRERDTNRYKWEGEDQEAQMKAAKDALLTSGVQRDMYRNNMANDDASRKLKERELDWKMKSEGSGAGATAAMEKQFQEIKANSSYSMGTYGTKEGMTNLAKELTARGIQPGQRDDILFNLSKYYKNGVPITHTKDGQPDVRVPLPISTILEEVDRATDFGFFGVSRKGDDTVNKLDARFGIKSDGSVDTTYGTRDQELANEMVKFNKLLHDRTKSINDPNTNKEIMNPPPKGKKGKGGGGGNGFPANPKVGDETSMADKSTYKYTAAGWVRQYKGLD